MSKSTDERGRIYLPKDPVDSDPVEGLREAVGDAFAGTDVGDLKGDIRENIDDEVADESEETS